MMAKKTNAIPLSCWHFFFGKTKTKYFCLTRKLAGAKVVKQFILSDSFSLNREIRRALKFNLIFVLFLRAGAYHDKISPDGVNLSDHMVFGSVVATILVIVVTAQVALDTNYWTAFNHVTIWGSIAVYFILQFSYNYIFNGSYIGSLQMVRVKILVTRWRR